MANRAVPETHLENETIEHLMRCIEKGCREFGPLDLIALHAALNELLNIRKGTPLHG